MRNILILISFLTLTATLTACSVYRIDVQQGNAIDDEKLSQLKPGMNKTQVQYLMGSAMLVDPFHPQRWEYIYSIRKGGEDMKRKRITLIFKEGVLATIDKSQYQEQTFN